jgi:16S rRNA (guanine1207-N2)-methyltransferase
MAKQPHYFSEQPQVASDRRLVRLELRGLDLDLWTDRGVFAGDRVDPGTKALLEEAPEPPPAARNLLDLGCGYGPIAVTLARMAPAAKIWAVDVNRRAVELARENARLCGCPNVHACAPAEVPPGLRFDAIYSNPPVRIGKDDLHALLLGWIGKLAEGGRAFLVVQRHLGADSLASWLAAQGLAVRRLASKRGYRVIEVSAKSS